jgi:hypothetical protein
MSESISRSSSYSATKAGIAIDAAEISSPSCDSTGFCSCCITLPSLPTSADAGNPGASRACRIACRSWSCQLLLMFLYGLLTQNVSLVWLDSRQIRNPRSYWICRDEPRENLRIIFLYPSSTSIFPTADFVPFACGRAAVLLITYQMLLLASCNSRICRRGMETDSQISIWWAFTRYMMSHWHEYWHAKFEMRKEGRTAARTLQI